MPLGNPHKMHPGGVTETTDVVLLSLYLDSNGYPKGHGLTSDGSLVACCKDKLMHAHIWGFHAQSTFHNMVTTLQ